MTSSSSTSMPNEVAGAPPARPTYLSKTTDHAAHLKRLLSSTDTLDTALLTTSYTLHLLHASLPPSSSTTSPQLTTSPRSRLAPLAALLDEYRVLLRLSGLVGIFTSGATLYSTPPADLMLRCLAWGQVCSIAVYQALENAALLSQKGIFNWAPEKRGKALVWACRCWMVYVGLQLGKLGWELKVRRQQEEEGKAQKESAGAAEKNVGGEGEGEGKGELQLREEKVEAEEWWDRWKRQVGVSLAYAPMTVHYSFGDGFLGEGAIGALGVFVGWLTIGEAWEASA